MGNIIGSFFSGFIKVIGDLFGSPLDFLSGKSCRYIYISLIEFGCFVIFIFLPFFFFFGFISVSIFILP